MRVGQGVLWDFEGWIGLEYFAVVEAVQGLTSDSRTGDLAAGLGTGGVWDPYMAQI